MLPYINIFTINLSTYGLCVLAGVFAAGGYVCRVAKKRGHNNNDYIVLMLIAAIGIMIGGHIMYAVTKIPQIITLFSDFDRYIKGFDDVVLAAGLIFGGAVFYGGLFGGMAAGAIYAKKKRMSLGEASDICAPAVPLFHMFGRIGCFLSGCCYGVESAFGFTAHGNELVPSINDVQRFPVQLLEATLNLLLFLTLAYMLKNSRLKGRLFAVYLLSYSVIRFFDEFLRGDEYRGIWLGLSTSQWISLILFVVTGIYLLIKTLKSKKLN